MGEGLKASEHEHKVAQKFQMNMQKRFGNTTTGLPKNTLSSFHGSSRAYDPNLTFQSIVSEEVAAMENRFKVPASDAKSKESQ